MTELARAVEPARSRRIVSWAIGLTAVLATAVGMKIALAPSPVPPPPAPSPPAAPTVVPIPAPQLVVVQPPVPPAPPAPEEPVRPEPRALVPSIRPECVGLPIGMSETQCQWDTGFPAISADGTTIATAFVPWEEERGASGLIVKLVDVVSGKTVRTFTVLDASEFVDPETPKHAAMRRAIDRRSATAQRELDAGGYRSMLKLYSDTDSVFTELDEDAFRLIDRAANTVLWQRRFDLALEFPNRKLDGVRCEPTSISTIAVTWDPPTRTALAQVTYSQEAEHCSWTERSYPRRVQP